VGMWVGDSDFGDGATVGKNDGEVVGALVGEEKDGALVGKSVGTIVGSLVNGDCVGTIVLTTTTCFGLQVPTPPRFVVSGDCVVASPLPLPPFLSLHS